MSFAVVAAVGVGVASAGVNYASQASAANTQNAYRRRLGISQNKQFQENATAVIKDIGSQIDQLAQRDIQQAAATRQELDGIIRNARQTQGSFRAQVGAAGVQGRSVDMLHDQFQRGVAEFESVAARNIQNMKMQSGIDAKAIYARGQSAINQGYPNPLPPAQTVSAATSIMNGISTGFSAYGSLNSAFSNPNPGVGSQANTITNAPPNLIAATPNQLQWNAMTSTPPTFLSR
jgi:hypothetical protein